MYVYIPKKVTQFPARRFSQAEEWLQQALGVELLQNDPAEEFSRTSKKESAFSTGKIPNKYVIW